MLLTCWSAKGGSGTTTVAAALALISSDHRRTLFVDLAGDGAAVLGLADPDGPGYADWLDSSTADRAALGRLTVEVAPSLRLLTPGAGAGAGPPDLIRLIEVLREEPGPVVVDAGLVGSDDDAAVSMVEASDESVLVTRACYLALRRAMRLTVAPTSAVVLTEPGRALRASDVSRALGVAVAAEVPADPAVARAVDAGLALSRLPRLLRRSLASVQP